MAHIADILEASPVAEAIAGYLYADEAHCFNLASRFWKLPLDYAQPRPPSVEYVYLDSEERQRFAPTGHEYLIEQLIVETE